MLMPPKNFCNQSIVFKRKLASNPDDVYDEPKFDQGTTINNVVVHLRTVYSGTNNDREIVANGVVMIYNTISAPFIKLSKDDLGSKVVYEGKEYTVTNINQDYDPMSTKMYQYKLEIV